MRGVRIVAFLLTPHYFPAKPAGRREDGFGFNLGVKVAVACDGCSEPHVGKPLPYGDRWESGGQMATETISSAVNHASGSFYLPSDLMVANTQIALNHQKIIGRDVTKELAGGCCVAGLQVLREEALFLVAGDAHIVWRDRDGVHCLTNFDDEARKLEAFGNLFFEQCKVAAARLDIPSGWPVYRNWFEAKQAYRWNRNRGKGGFAVFNGHPDVQDYWTRLYVKLDGLAWVLLLTDGMLKSDFTPADVGEVAEAFECGGPEALIKLRDGGPDLPHIKRPEGTVVVATGF
ncbi:hypothetical protein KW786_00730 [Candidatus Parcubacteria bacterium]|nr:hypothetical protein [Candidatus Parcubacteria bacterium]